MKKSLFPILTLLLTVLCGFSASAQDFTTTVQWSVPGTVRILKGTSFASAKEMTIPAGATSFTLTEATGYYVAPAEGYFLKSATIDGASQNLTPASYSEPANKVFNINANFPGRVPIFNGKTIVIDVEKLTYQNYEVEVANGAGSFECNLYANENSSNGSIKLNNGVNNLQYSNQDQYLYLRDTSYPRKVFYSVTLNGVAQTPYNTVQNYYLIPLSPGCKIYIAYADPGTYTSYDVTFKFTNNNPDCLNNIFNWTSTDFIYPAEFGAPGYKLTVDKGTQIQFNFNEDAKVNSVTANGKTIASPAGTKITIEENTEFVIDATMTTYADATALIYTNDIEHITLLTSLGADAENVKYEFVEDCPANSVTLACGFTIPQATKLYKATNINGKTNRFFFEMPEGYWLKEGVIANIDEDDISDDAKYISGSTSVAVADAPVYFDVQKINFNTPAYVYMEGPENSAKLSVKDSWGAFTTYEGQKDYVPTGWSTIKFDSNGYDATFIGRVIAGSTTQSYKGTIVLDGTPVKADDNGLYNMTNVKENSVIKMFFTPTAVAPFNVTFSSTGYAPAKVVYDMVKEVTDFSAAVVNYGATTYTITPGANVIVKVNGTEATPVNGVITVTLDKASTISFEQNLANDTMQGSLKPAAGATVRKIENITWSFPFDGEHMIDMDPEAVSLITLTPANGAREGAVSAISIEPGEPSETEIPLIISFPAQTAAGEYTLDIPAGLVHQTTYNVANDSYEFGAGCAASAAVSAKYTVDPNKQLEWSANPANGSQNELPNGMQVIVLSLPDAETLSTASVNEASGPWVKYNGTNIKKVEDPYEEEGWGFTETMETYGKPAIAIAISKNVISKVGTLEITAEAGAFTVDENEASPALNYVAKFGEAKEYTALFTPARGSDVENFDAITLTFEGAKTVALDEDNKYVVFRTAEAFTWGTENVAITCEGNTVTFKPEINMALTPGEYLLTIGEGTFILDGVQTSEELAATWNLVRTSEKDQSWNPTPEKNVLNMGWGINVGFVFGEIETIAKGDNFDKIAVTFNGTAIPVGNGSDRNNMYYQTMLESSMPNVLMVSAAGGILNNSETEGEFKVTIPVGGIKISGEANEAPIEFTWNFMKMKEYQVKLTPATGSVVKSLGEVTVEFTNAETATVGEYFQPSWISLRKGYSTYSIAESVTPVEGAEHPTFVVKFAKAADTEGSYSLNISSGSFYLDGVQESDNLNADYTVDTTLTGIEGIYAPDGLFNVVSIQGIVVLRNATADKVQALPAGLYIINGKKVNLRK